METRSSRATEGCGGMSVSEGWNARPKRWLSLPKPSLGERPNFVVKIKTTLSRFDRDTDVKCLQNRKRKVFYEEEICFDFDDDSWSCAFCGGKDFPI